MYVDRPGILAYAYVHAYTHTSAYTVHASALILQRMDQLTTVHDIYSIHCALYIVDLTT